MITTGDLQAVKLRPATQTPSDDKLWWSGSMHKIQPFIATMTEHVHEILALLNLTPDDLLVDLGCGDGRFCIEAVRLYGCRAVGLDIERPLVDRMLTTAKEASIPTVRLHTPLDFSLVPPKSIGGAVADVVDFATLRAIVSEATCVTMFFHKCDWQRVLAARLAALCFDASNVPRVLALVDQPIDEEGNGRANLAATAVADVAAAPPINCRLRAIGAVDCVLWQGVDHAPTPAQRGFVADLSGHPGWRGRIREEQK